MLVHKKYHLFLWGDEGRTGATGTTHGSPYSYDTHVPLVVMGPGVKAGVRHERVSPELTAALLAKGRG